MALRSLRPRCTWPGCLADATHRLYFWPRGHVWHAQLWGNRTARYCRWHASVESVQRNAALRRGDAREDTPC
jgi:hypothetical protein